METDKTHIVLSAIELSKKFESHSKGEGEFWSLKDISFDLKKGEILGVIGKNGAGKSTLLKVLSQIITPTEGRIEYEGTLTSILEIGTGFHPELSGRENVYLGASIMGLSKKEIAGLYDTIVEFSGLEGFMDRPVKHYSSGMYLRLAFSVAFHSRIDILLLDEVLAVGDADFRRKCYKRIRQLKNEGASIIIVSHFMDTVISFCDRCLLLDDGRLVLDGQPIDIVEYYLNGDRYSDTGDAANGGDLNVNYTFDFSSMNLPALDVQSFKIISESAESAGFEMNDPIEIQMKCKKHGGETSFEIAYLLKNMNDVQVFIDSPGLKQDYKIIPMKAGQYTVRCLIPGKLLNRGVYSLGMIISENTKAVKEIDEVAIFKVNPPANGKYDAQITSVIRPHLEWEIAHVNPD